MLITSYYSRPAFSAKNPVSVQKPQITFGEKKKDTNKIPDYIEMQEIIKDAVSNGKIKDLEIYSKSKNSEARNNLFSGISHLTGKSQNDKELLKGLREAIKPYLNEKDEDRHFGDALKLLPELGNYDDVYDYGLKYLTDPEYWRYVYDGIILNWAKDGDEKLLKGIVDIIEKPGNELYKGSAFGALALKSCGKPDTINFIKSYADNKDDDIRSYAMWALGNAFEKGMKSSPTYAEENKELKSEIIDIAMKNVNHKYYYVRNNSLETINKLADKSDPNVNNLIEKLIPIANKRLKNVYQGLSDREYWDRINQHKIQDKAVEILGKIGEGNKKLEDLLVDRLIQIDNKAIDWEPIDTLEALYDVNPKKTTSLCKKLMAAHMINERLGYSSYSGKDKEDAERIVNGIKKGVKNSIDILTKNLDKLSLEDRRKYVAFAIYKTMDKVDFESIIKGSKEKTDPVSLIKSCTGSQRIKTSTTSKELNADTLDTAMKNLDNEDFVVRMDALEAIGQLAKKDDPGIEDVINKLIPLVNYRCATYERLSRQWQSDVTPKDQKELNNQDMIQDKAVEVLGKIAEGNKNAEDILAKRVIRIYEGRTDCKLKTAIEALYGVNKEKTIEFCKELMAADIKSDTLLYSPYYMEEYKHKQDSERIRRELGENAKNTVKLLTNLDKLSPDKMKDYVVTSTCAAINGLGRPDKTIEKVFPGVHKNYF